MGQEAKDAKSVVDGHNDNPAGGQVGPIVPGRGAFAVQIGAPVNPDHHRESAAACGLFGPHIEGEAVFADRQRDRLHLVLRPERPSDALGPHLEPVALGAGRAESGCVLPTRPGPPWDWRAPTSLTDRGLCEPDSLKDRDLRVR